MRHPVSAACAALILGAAMQPLFAQSTVAPQHPGDPGYEALLEMATAPVRDAFGHSVQVDVDRLDHLGRWAFLQGTLRNVDGGRPDYADTPYAARAEQGGMSDVYVALLRSPAAGADPASAADDPAAPLEQTDASAAPSTPDPDGEPAEWTLVDHSIGPSDVSWLTWPQAYAAPRQLFGF